MAPKVSWCAEEDAAMMAVLRDEKANGNQSDSGWKGVVWQKVAERLEKLGVPQGGSGKKTANKCSDHYGNLKSAYKDFSDLVDKSGFGWDEEKQMVTAAEHVWEDLLKNPENKRKFQKWRKMAFPCYRDMQHLCDGIVATGAGAFRAGTEASSSVSPPLQGDEEDETAGAAAGPSESANRDLSMESFFFLDADSPAIGPNDAQDKETHDASDLDTPSPSVPISGTKRKSSSASAPSLPSASASGSSSSSHKRKKRSSIVDKPDPFGNLSNSIQSLGAHLNSNSPVRRSRAIALLYEDGDFSEDESVEVMALFTTNTAAADSYCFGPTYPGTHVTLPFQAGLSPSLLHPNLTIALHTKLLFYDIS